VVSADELREAAEACEEALARYYGGQHILLRVATASRALDTPIETVRAWIRKGELVGVHVGRSLYVTRQDLVDFVERHRRAPAPPRKKQHRGRRGRFDTEV
jgi:excisionase family DNA binding protein